MENELKVSFYVKKNGVNEKGKCPVRHDAKDAAPAFVHIEKDEQEGSQPGDTPARPILQHSSRTVLPPQTRKTVAAYAVQANSQEFRTSARLVYILDLYRIGVPT